MLGEKEKFCILANKFQGIEPVYMLQILCTSVKILGKLKTVLEILRNSTWGLRVDKRRFKLLHFKNKTISFTYTPYFSTLRQSFSGTYLESCQISMTELFGITIFAKKLHNRFSIGFQIRLCNGRRYPKVKWLFRKFQKYLRKKPFWSTVLVEL